MLTLNQRATLPGGIASLQHCKESIFNISNRAPVAPDAGLGEKRDELRAVLGRMGCGQVMLKRDRVIEASATAHAILEREYPHISGRETLYSALKQLFHRAGAQFQWARPHGWRHPPKKALPALSDKSSMLARMKPALSSCLISMLIRNQPLTRCSVCLASQQRKRSSLSSWHEVAICLT